MAGGRPQDRRHAVSGGARRLGLGTAQFGLAYGLTNMRGQVTHDEARSILALARRAGVSLIDTAHEYGDSESAIGLLDDETAGLRIVTKTPSIGGSRIDEEQLSSVRRAIETSRKSLRREQLDGLLVHNGQALLLPGGDRLLALIQEAKARGLVARIGVSIFDPAALEQILDRFTPDLVQLPLNLLDQRFLARGLVRTLAARGVEIHARSVFLQGVLLAAPEDLPASLDRARPALDAVRKFCQAHRLAPITACLGFVLAQPEINHAVVGITCVDELAAIVAASEWRSENLPDFASLAIDDLDIIAPSRWPVRQADWGNSIIPRSA
jgi:aryl-alcohol dehydrogenase-like predicted oxidoreductase